MDHAAYMNGDQTEVVTIEMIENHQMEEETIKDCFCDECGGPATLVHKKTLFFRAFHEDECSIPKDGRKHRTHRIASDILVDDVNTMISYRDKDPNGTGGPKGDGHGDGPGGGPGQGEPWDEQDLVNKYGICHIHTVSGMYKYPDAFLEDGKTCCRDYILDERALYEARQDGIDGPKIAIVKRVHPSQLKHDITIPEGYTLFVDRFTPDVQDAVFFLVKLSNKAVNKHFREKVMGEEKRDRHKDLLLLGKWKRFRNEHYIVYKCITNSRCCHFFTYEG